MIKLEALFRDGTKFELKTIYINPAFVVSIREDSLLTKDLRCENMAQKFPKGLNAAHTLSEVVYNEANISKRLTVIGAPEVIQARMGQTSTKTLLRG